MCSDGIASTFLPSFVAFCMQLYICGSCEIFHVPSIISTNAPIIIVCPTGPMTIQYVQAGVKVYQPLEVKLCAVMIIPYYLHVYISNYNYSFISILWKKTEAVSSSGPGPSVAAFSVEKSTPQYVTMTIVAS